MQSITCFSKRSKQMIRLCQQSFSKVLNVLDIIGIFSSLAFKFGQVDSHFLSRCGKCFFRGFVLSGCTRHGRIWGQSLLRLSEGLHLDQKGCLGQIVWVSLGHFRETIISTINNGIYKSWDFNRIQVWHIPVAWGALDTYVADMRFPLAWEDVLFGEWLPTARGWDVELRGRGGCWLMIGPLGLGL